jgi:hypothetical protein
MAAAEDQQPVEALGPDGADEALGVSVAWGCTDRGVDDSDVFAAKDLVEGRREFGVSRSWTRNRIRSNTPVKLRLRACWVTQAPLGLVVQPANWGHGGYQAQ